MPNLDLPTIGMALIGAGLPILLSMNIFATKADVETSKLESAEKYVTKVELKQQMDRMEADIKEILRRLNK